jgi:hypothetical protein
MGVLNIVKSNKFITITSFLILVVIGYYYYSQNKKQQYELFLKNNHPKVEVDSVFFPSQVGNLIALNLLITNPIDFDKLGRLPVLELPLVMKIKVGDKSIRKIFKLFVCNNDSTFSMRKKILENKMNFKDYDETKLEQFGLFDNINIKANEHIRDTFNVKLIFDFRNPLRKYYIHYIFVYQSDAGGIYDIYYIKELIGYGSDLINPKEIKCGFQIPPTYFCEPKIYNEDEVDKLIEFIEKIYKVKIDL